MEATIQKQSIKHDLMILFMAAVITVTFIGYRSTVAPHYLPTSKIEEGSIVVKNDSITTIIIPDKR